MHRFNILIFEDNVDIAAGLADVLESGGHDLIIALTGSEGIRISEQTDIDLTLLDYKLPDMNGIACLQALRKNSPRSKFVIMTGEQRSGARRCRR